MESRETLVSTQKLTEALSIALDAHKDQKDKGGNAYILHPLRLMMQCHEEDLQIIALLHDVIEDSSVELYELEKKGFNKEIIDALNVLTKKNDENYFDYIDRVAKNELARNIKILDIRDNLNLSRLTQVTDKDFKRVQKYLKALNILCGNRR